ncbi:MAG: Mini-ribonuclease 3 [Clostridiales bacterium]|nr:Mini-ribonuclease 3 [Clostridiales bacterium]
METSRIDRLTPVALAFIGDAVYTLYVRERVCAEHDGVTGTLHTMVSAVVNANMQAAVFGALCESGELTEEESDIARRAKNAHLHSRAKAADSTAYHKATALEAILGFVHLSGDGEREKSLLDKCYALAQRFLQSRA